MIFEQIKALKEVQYLEKQNLDLVQKTFLDDLEEELLKRISKIK